MKSLLRSITRRNAFIALLPALILTAVIVRFSNLPLKPFHAEIRQSFTNDANPQILYHDFAHDGVSEKVVFKFNPDIYEPVVKLYNLKDEEIGIWQLGERWVRNSMGFGDYDNNGIDECYFITQDNDSLFIYGFNPDTSNSQFIVERAFLTSAKESRAIERRIWDVSPGLAGWLDPDRDSYRDLNINLCANNALQPRRSYIFSIRKKKILTRSPFSGSRVGGHLVRDLDGDGKKEILTGSSSAEGNYQEPVPYRDDRCYLFLFNEKLQVRFEPVVFPYSNSIIHFQPIQSGDSTRILGVLSHFGTAERSATLYAFDLQGRQLWQKKLPYEDQYRFIPVGEMIPDRLLLYSDAGNLRYVDKNGAVTDSLHVRRRPASSGFEFQFSGDLDNDGIDEWLFKGGDYYLVKSDLSNVLPLNLPFLTRTPTSSICSVEKNQRLLSLHVDYRHYLIDYKANPFYPYRIPLLIALFLVCFFLSLFIIQLINTLLAYMHFIQKHLRRLDAGILLVNQKGNITQVNDTFNRLTGKHDIRRGQTAGDALTHLSALTTFISQLLAEKKERTEEISFTIDRNAFQGKLHGYPLPGFFGQPAGFAIELTDYSQPIQSDRQKIWAKTVQKMAHDIKTPLSAIVLKQKTIQKKLDKINRDVSKEVGADFSAIDQQMSRVREMTVQFLKFTNLEKPQISIFELHTLLDKVLGDYRDYEASGIEFIREFNASLGALHADARQLEMVLRILIENAIDALQGKGIIMIDAQRVQPVVSDFKEFMQIEIADSGPGIDAEIKQKLFEPYFTTKNEGTGMGLAIAKKIIEDHQGEIKISSRVNFATVFRIMLPNGHT